MLKTCSFTACDREHAAKGLCQSHYLQQKKGKPLTELKVREKSKTGFCTIKGCKNKYAAKGLCQAHIARKRMGAINSDKPINIFTPGEWRPWRINSDGYVYRYRHEGKRAFFQTQHRLVMEKHLGRPLVKGENVHHINGDRADNRIDNLELWSKVQPAGQRAKDKLAWAHEIIDLYENIKDKI